MPRSRRRHHSRSRSRSRSHSHDRDRDAKRRKIDSVESPTHKRSVSSNDEDQEQTDHIIMDRNSSHNKNNRENNSKKKSEKRKESTSSRDECAEEDDEDEGDITEKSQKSTEDSFKLNKESTSSNIVSKALDEKLNITPKKTLSPKQLQRKLESEKKKEQRQLEREEKEKQRQAEKEKIRLEKEKQKKEKEKERLEKNEQKAKERELKEEQKRKELEEKEQKRKEKEEREDQKKKERERKQQQLEEKNKEKQKLEEQKQKAAAAFANFFLQKKSSEIVEERKAEMSCSKFMPFEIKSDMRLPPARRPEMTNEEKNNLVAFLKMPDKHSSYLLDVKTGKQLGSCLKTWPYEDVNDDDIIIVEEDFGESICEEKPKLTKTKSKFLKFHENRRPAYFGTWRKKSSVIKSRKPLVKDATFFDYDIDSDDDWEEEEQGESLNGSDDEDKENEVENDDFEVDDFLVPHGYLSDDEIDDEITAKLSPESQKQKLKLLQDQFDQDMKSKTHKIKPRFIGCIWYNKDGSNIEEAIDRHLKPLSMITNGNILVKKRSEILLLSNKKATYKELKEELIVPFLKLIHGNTKSQKNIVKEFLVYLENNGFESELSKASIVRNLKHFAKWKKCTDEGPMLNKFCWNVHNEILEKYSVNQQ